MIDLILAYWKQKLISFLKTLFWLALIGAGITFLLVKLAGEIGLL